MNERPASRARGASRSGTRTERRSGGSDARGLGARGVGARGSGAQRRKVEHGAVEPTKPRRPWYRRIPVILALVIVITGGVAAIAWFTPALGVRTIEVSGTADIAEREITVALDIPQGQPLPRVDTAAAAARVAAIPKVSSARVQRIYPSTIRVTVIERVPAVFIDSVDGTHLIDREGVDFAISPPPPGVPRLVTDNPGWGDPATSAALEILESLPPQLREQVGEIRARSISDVSIVLHGERTVIWGSTDKSARKGAVALPLLTQPGQIYDVSSPDLPTVR